jgi:hypothetical protein
MSVAFASFGVPRGIILAHLLPFVNTSFVPNFSAGDTFAVNDFSLSVELCVSPEKADFAGTGRTGGRVQKENLGIKYLSC